jgi:hypothetical protein
MMTVRSGFLLLTVRCSGIDAMTSPTIKPIYPTDEEVIDVLTNANRRQRKLIKKIAESLIAHTLYKH